MTGIKVCCVFITALQLCVRSTNGYPFDGPGSETGKFDEVYRWKEIAFTPLDNDRRFNDITISDILASYIPANNLPTGVSRSGDRIFMTLPRRRPGIPATVAYVRIGGFRGSSPTLHAYPDFRTNQLHPQSQADSQRIVSVWKSRVCPCNRLWFVDTGVLDFPDNRIQVQQPSIWVFDLRTDTLIRRYEIPRSVVSASHGMVSITIDVDRMRCDDAYAYLPDIKNFRLNVYSFRDNQAWAFSHNFLGYNPLRGDFDIGGQQYQWGDGIFSVALSEPDQYGFKTAYFHSLSSTSEFAVSTQILRNQSLASRPREIRTNFTYVGERSKRGQSNMHAYDPATRIMFYTQVSLNAIGCWNTAAPLSPSNLHILQQNNETMIYPSDIMIDHDRFLWTITNRLPIYQYGTPNSTDYNIRIFKASINDIIVDTPCQHALPADFLFPLPDAAIIF